MPTDFSTENIVQVNQGSFSGTSGSATLPAGTTAGSTLLVMTFTNGANEPSMTGFTKDASIPVFSHMSTVFRKSNVAASETSWTITIATGQPCVWIVMEVVGLDRFASFDLFDMVSGSNVSSLNNGGPRNTGYEQFGIWFYGGINTADNTIPVWDGFTNNLGLAEKWAEVSRQEASTALGAAVAVSVMGDSYDSSDLNVLATTNVPVNAVGMNVFYHIENGKRRANPDVMTGFEFGTTAGWTVGPTNTKIIDAAAGTPAIVTTSPRSGTYCLELSSSAAIENITWTSAGVLGLYAGALSAGVMRFSVYFPTSLPAGDVELAAVGTTNGVTIRYRSASQKIGVQVVGTTPAGSGTEQLSATTVVAGQWYDIDVCIDGRTTGTWTCRWQLDGVDQTDATHTQTAVLSIGTVRLGWGSATTATVRYDDVMFSRVWAHYPLGNTKIYPLPVDPAGTPTVTTAANFSTFTNNGTLNATFNVTTARNAIDEIPPTIGASADGFAQDTGNSSDHVRFPMSTRSQAGTGEFIRALRWYFCGWAASGTAATIGFKSISDVQVDLPNLTLLGTTDAGFDNSTTAPAWVCAMQRPVASTVAWTWSQAVLDDLDCQIGFSSDASPAIGVHAAFAELAMRVPDVVRVAENDGVTLDAHLDPDSGAIMKLVLTAAPGGPPAVGNYEIFGSTVTRNATDGAPDTYVVGAETTRDVTFLSCGPE